MNNDLTPSELDYVLHLARQVHVKHKVFDSLEYELRTRSDASILGSLRIEIVVRMTVTNREASPHVEPRPEPADFQAKVSAISQIINLGTVPKDMTRIPIVAIYPLHLNRDMLRDPEALVLHIAASVRQAMRDVACHEIDEMLMIDDRRPYDPHVLKASYTFTEKGVIDNLEIKGKIVV